MKSRSVVVDLTEHAHMEGERREQVMPGRKGRTFMSTKFKPGEAVIYRVTKRSTHPGPRATEIRPAKRGDSYTYAVEKFWRVKETLDDGTLVLLTRRGKERTCSPDDPNIRRPGLLARWMYADRFPQETE